MASTTNILAPAPQLDHLQMQNNQSTNSTVVANPVPFELASAEISLPLAHTNRTLVLCFDGTGDQ